MHIGLHCNGLMELFLGNTINERSRYFLGKHSTLLWMTNLKSKFYVFVYQILKLYPFRAGYKGEACLLKLICESNHFDVGQHNGILGNVFHVLFSWVFYVYDLNICCRTFLLSQTFIVGGWRITTPLLQSRANGKA